MNREINFIKKLEEKKFKVYILEVDKNEVIVFSKDNDEWITVESRYWEGEYWYHWGVPTKDNNNMVTIGIGMLTKELNLDNVNEMIRDQYRTYNEELEMWKINDIKELS